MTRPRVEAQSRSYPAAWDRADPRPTGPPPGIRAGMEEEGTAEACGIEGKTASGSFGKEKERQGAPRTLLFH